MLDWLNQNSGAVQGISAIVTAGVTVLLVIVTTVYVLMTKEIADTTSDQFAATIQPVVDLGISERHTTQFFDAQSSVESTLVVGEIVVKNIGPSPIILTRVAVVAQSWRDNAIQTEKTDVEVIAGQVLLPSKDRLYKFGMQVPLRTKDPRISVGVYVECCDLARISGHAFTLISPHGLRYAFLGSLRPTPHVRFKARCRRAWSSLDGLARWENTSERRRNVKS